MEKTLSQQRFTVRITTSDTFMILGLGVALLIAPAIGNQIITGTLVNAILIFSAYRYGWKIAALLGMFPSGISLLIGFLPAVAAPLLPFIVIGNLLYVFVFSSLLQKGFWLGAGVAVVVKTALLIASGFFVVSLVGDSGLVRIASSMFTWMQGLTATLGTLLAFGVMQLLTSHPISPRK